MDFSPDFSKEFTDLVERELRGDITRDEQTRLLNAQPLWRNELLKMKRRAEQHMTSSRTKSFELFKQQYYGEITQQEYISALQEEKVKRTNTNRFLQQIESRLLDVGATN